MDADETYDGMLDCVKAAQDLPAQDISNVLTDIGAGEWELALETMCDQLYEYDLCLAPEGYALFVQMGERLGVDVPARLGRPAHPGPGGGRQEVQAGGTARERTR